MLAKPIQSLQFAVLVHCMAVNEGQDCSSQLPNGPFNAKHMVNAIEHHQTVGLHARTTQQQHKWQHKSAGETPIGRDGAVLAKGAEDCM